MKRIAAVAAVMLALLSGGVAHALGPHGTLPPEPEDIGTLSVTGGYALREMRMEPRVSGYAPITARQNHFFVQVTDESYGWEWSGRLGVADFSDGQQFDAGYKPFGGIGLKGSLYGDRAATFGLEASIRADVYSRYKIAGVTVSPDLQANVRVKDLWDAEAALLAHRHFGPVTVYGGPSLEYVEAKVYRTTTTGSSIDATGDSYYKKQSVAGVVGGVSWLRDKKRFGFEAGLSGGSYSAGVNAGFNF